MKSKTIEKGAKAFYAGTVQAVDFSIKNPDINIRTTIQQSLVNKNGEASKIEKLKKKHWPKNQIVPHWSGFGVKRRAKLVGKEYEAFYNQTYPLMSWYTHSGPSGHYYVDEDGLRAVFARGHELSQTMFIEATVLIAKEFSLDKAAPNFYKNIKKLVIPQLQVGTHCICYCDPPYPPY